jgi:hypothetical protein
VKNGLVGGTRRAVMTKADISGPPSHASVNRPRARLVCRAATDRRRGRAIDRT